jgi:hypothetical protein
MQGRYPPQYGTFAWHVTLTTRSKTHLRGVVMLAVSAQGAKHPRSLQTACEQTV